MVLRVDNLVCPAVSNGIGGQKRQFIPRGDGRTLKHGAMEGYLWEECDLTNPPMDVRNRNR
jgi:hypothetical protein